MKLRDLVGFSLGGVFGMILLAFLVGEPWRSRRPDRTPTLGGQEVPQESFTIDFAKRYNVFCGGSRGPETYRNVRVLGYTGSTAQEKAGSFSSHRFFEHWLAIELPDKRHAYLTPSSISYLEEVEPTSVQ